MSVFKGRGVAILAPNSGIKGKQTVHRNSMIVQLPPYKQKVLSPYEPKKQGSLSRIELEPLDPEVTTHLPQIDHTEKYQRVNQPSSTFYEADYPSRANYHSSQNNSYEQSYPSRGNYERDSSSKHNFYSQSLSSKPDHDRNNQDNSHQKENTSTNIAPTFQSLDIFNVTFDDPPERCGRPTTSQLSKRPQYSQYITEETNTYDNSQQYDYRY